MFGMIALIRHPILNWECCSAFEFVLYDLFLEWIYPFVVLLICDGESSTPHTHTRARIKVYGNCKAVVREYDVRIYLFGGCCARNDISFLYSELLFHFEFKF